MDHRHATPTATHTYRAFLLRLWREDANTSWRCSLQTTDTLERRGFADIHQLATFLLLLAEEAGTQLSDPPTSESPG